MTENEGTTTLHGSILSMIHSASSAPRLHKIQRVAISQSNSQSYCTNLNSSSRQHSKHIVLQQNCRQTDFPFVVKGEVNFVCSDPSSAPPGADCAFPFAHRGLRGDSKDKQTTFTTKPLLDMDPQKRAVKTEALTFVDQRNGHNSEISYYECRYTDCRSVAGI